MTLFRAFSASHLTAVLAVGLLAGCADGATGGLDQRPRSKPAEIPVFLEGPLEETPILASVSTRAGQMRVLTPGGEVETLDLSRRQTSEEAAVTAPNGGLSQLFYVDETVDLTALPPEPTEQERALEAFAARSTSSFPVGFAPPNPDALLGAEIRRIEAEGPVVEDGLMVKVLINTRAGLNVAQRSAYTQCSLAGWASQAGVGNFARRINTISARKENVQADHSVFLISKEKPLGLEILDVKDVLRQCAATGIPTRVYRRVTERDETKGIGDT